MKLTPTHKAVALFDTTTEEDLTFSCCDSAVAVLTDDQVTTWLATFQTLTQAVDATEYCDFGSRILAFDIDGKNLVVVSDSGGELVAGEFEVWCEANGIPCQSIVDSLDCEGIDVEDIYTGAGVDHPDLLAMVHRLYN